MNKRATPCDTLDAVATSIPVNKQAAVVTGKGEHWVPNKRIATYHSVLPFRTVPMPKGIQMRVGMRVGRLSVFGRADGNDRNGMALYVMRCDCGRYTKRKAKSITNPNNIDDACEECRHLQFLQRRDSAGANWRAMGAVK